MNRISIVLPAFHSDATLGPCLAALAAQERPPEEVIVVNSSPETETAAVVAGFPGVRLIQSPVRLLPHAARNRGLAEASGDLLVCSDPDVVADRHWLRRLEGAAVAGHPLVGGGMALHPPPAERRLTATAIHLAKFWWILPAGPARPVWITPTANCAFTRALWARVGPFPEDVFCGDALFSWRAARAGAPPWLVPDAIVAHDHDETAAAMRSQRYRRGQEFARVRAHWEGWSTPRRWAQVLASPGRLARVLRQAKAAATAAGWAGEFQRTWHLHAGMQAAWVAGEARGWLRRAGPGSK